MQQEIRDKLTAIIEKIVDENQCIDGGMIADGIIEAGILNERPQRGAEWVKASERLPGWDQPVHWRIGNGPQTKGKTPVNEMSKGVNIAIWQWLDESGQSKERNKEREMVFAQWVIDNGWKPRINDEWARYVTLYSDISIKTTTELWNEWNTQQKK